MPDFQYQPPTGPLSGSEFERQTTRFFQQVQGAADAAQSTAIVAQNTANEAIERAQASNLVDGKTTQADADGTITAKDVAIGGDASDLASARGFFYDTYLPYYPGRGSNPVDDFNLLTLPGTYHIVVSSDTLNRPNISLFTGSGTNDGILEITMIGPASTVSSYKRLEQRFTVFGSDTKTWSRNQDTNVTTWYAWEQEIRTGDIGDGLRVTNGIISVPEMQGATSAQAGVSGLVPPPLAADAGKVLGSDGTWSFPKDVAIGGDLEDLASMRGQIGDNIRINTASDLNAYTKAGNWLFSDAAAETNFPTAGKGGELNCYVSTTAIVQFFTEFNNNRRYIRYGIPNSTWTNWVQFISVAQIGDGIRTTQGIISVPEYEGATASKAGTSGLVPPATAGQANYVLCGDGEWRDIATLVAAAQARLAESVKAEEGTS